VPAETTTLPPTRPSDPDLLRSILDVVQERGLKVGDQLPSIRDLAEQLEVKPTAVRDALLQAQAMGLVRILPRAGAFLQLSVPVAAEETLASIFPLVGSPQEPNLFHLLDARRLLEIELAGRAAERRCLEDLLPVHRALQGMLELPAAAPRAEYVNHDIRFHVEIVRLAGNSVLFAMQRTLMESLRPHLNAVPQSHERRGQTDHSHAAIYAALVAGDADSARAEMRRHLSMAYDSLLRDIQEPPSVGRRRASGA
jgi:GntR family transcriptional repressor for pyruvate dehydrogenase complex